MAELVGWLSRAVLFRRCLTGLNTLFQLCLSRFDRCKSLLMYILSAKAVSYCPYSGGNSKGPEPIISSECDTSKHSRLLTDDKRPRKHVWATVRAIWAR
ncbi:hypothetical protein BU16DRAFT_525588 [Lophium mytilinum]|uniref:Uncharacterized protein n=1 Tax=Lophium mytilinum TaxID=390894 RepID=A0A6A6R0X8_9PEZI|nr:hypothetical protein BU16DRAFT_525588 [Lophium mytilinum]